MYKNLKNKKIIISAGASGIGWSTAKLLLSRGATVYICDIDKKFINLLSPQLDKFGWQRATLANCRCPLCGDSKKNPNKKRGFFYERSGRYRERPRQRGEERRGAARQGGEALPGGVPEQQGPEHSRRGYTSTLHRRG